MRLYTSSRDLPWNSPWAQCGCRVLWSPSRERFIAVWTEEFSQGIQVWAPDATISMKLMVSQCPLPPPPIQMAQLTLEDLAFWAPMSYFHVLADMHPKWRRTQRKAPLCWSLLAAWSSTWWDELFRASASFPQHFPEGGALTLTQIWVPPSPFPWEVLIGRL